MAWTYNQRRTLLNRALELALPTGDPTTCNDFWIKDLSDTEVMYHVNRRTYKRTYELSDDGAVTFGDSEECVEQIDYRPIKVSSFALDEVVSFGISSVKMRGKVFRVGKYPDKGFEISQKEWDEKSQKTFSAVPLDLEHATKPDGTFLTKILDQDLGDLLSVNRKNDDVFGEVEIPKWLHQLSGGKVGVSLAFNADKKIVGCALTLRPRVAGAQVSSQFVAAFADDDVIDGMANDAPAQDKGFIAGVTAAVAGVFAAIGGGNAPAAPAPAIAPAESTTTTLSNDEKSELERLRTERAATVERDIKTFAQTETDKLKAEGKIVPAQENEVRAMFEQAFRDDNAESGAYFSDSGDAQKGDRTKALDAMFAKMPKNGLITPKAGEKAVVLSADETSEDAELTKQKQEGLKKGIGG